MPCPYVRPLLLAEPIPECFLDLNGMPCPYVRLLLL